jgi:hypothetical protein
MTVFQGVVPVGRRQKKSGQTQSTDRERARKIARGAAEPQTKPATKIRPTEVPEEFHALLFFKMELASWID